VAEHAICAADAALDDPQPCERFRGRGIQGSAAGIPADRHIQVARVGVSPSSRWPRVRSA
jgi:hypothetical protein